MPSGCLNPGEMPAYPIGDWTFIGYTGRRPRGQGAVRQAIIALMSLISSELDFIGVYGHRSKGVRS
jgi:hypothetical protein